MNILGLNIGHDSGCCLLLRDGRMLAVNEERLSRNKLHVGFPALAIRELLSIAPLRPCDIDFVVVDGKDFPPAKNLGVDSHDSDWKKVVVERLHLAKFFLGNEKGLMLARAAVKASANHFRRQVREHFAADGVTAPIEFVDHHTCHAASAYYTQAEFDRGLAITLDASGEGYCSKIFICDNNRMELVHQVPCYYSPAYYYGYITKLLGFTPLRHEGKVTGLAAFGNGSSVRECLRSLFGFDRRRGRFYNHGGYHASAMRRLREALASFSREDIAAGLQDHVEQVTSDYISWAIATFGKGQPANLFMAGGLLANVRINQRVLESPDVASLYVFPNMGDGGIGAGAALFARFQHDRKAARISLKNVFMGRDFTDDDIAEAIAFERITATRSPDITADVATLLAECKVVARFHGRCEYGPRALGNRSILFNPADRSSNDWLNKRLKRTEFMPFAPVVRDVDADEYFDLPNKSLRPFTFMTATCRVKNICREQAPAVVHVDGTARPQIIARLENAIYYDILTKFKAITGCGVLVNTSFNMHEEPIVYSPTEALKTFRAGGLDALAIGNFLCISS